MREEKLRELYNLCDSLQRLLDETYTGEKRRLRFKRPQETKTLQQIAQTIKECHKCDLGKTRTKSVPGEGFENARLLVVGEGPGRDEDTSGRPFVGQAGNYFETWMKAINFSRDR
ncbi:MAG: uracil-DNA glycosylase family protein, partial [Sphaerochaetaceae bacterium]